MTMWKKHIKVFLTLAFSSLFLFALLNAYVNPKILNQNLYNEFILFVSIVFETVMALLDGFVLAVIVKIFIKTTSFKNVLLVMFCISLFLNSLLGILNIFLIIFKISYIKACVTTVCALFKSIYFYLFLRMNFTTFNKITIIIGALWILLSSVPA